MAHATPCLYPPSPAATTEPPAPDLAPGLREAAAHLDRRADEARGHARALRQRAAALDDLAAVLTAEATHLRTQAGGAGG
jgi:hypothetical protein